MAECQVTRENTLYLMVQSPSTLFLYWDLTADYLTMACTSLQSVAPGLIIRLIRENGHDPLVEESRLITGHTLQGSMYFTRLRPHTVYLAELGLSYHGGFFTLLRSAYSLTPPAGKVASSISIATEIQILSPALPFAYSPQENSNGWGD